MTLILAKKPFTLHYYKCCNQDTLCGDKMIECCQTSSIPKEFRVYCSYCINKQELDSLNQ